MKKIFLIIGTRPEAIKMAPVYLELKKKSKFDVRIVFTGQHDSLIDQVFSFFGLTPEVILNNETRPTSMAEFYALMLSQINIVLQNEKPDLVLVQGDTLSAAVGAMASFFNKIQVAHVEAGLRTYDIYSPYPEESFRRYIDVIASWYYPPTKLTSDVLINEGIASEKLLITGNTGIDSLKWCIDKIKKDGNDRPLIEKYFSDEKKVLLCTLHRRENIGDGLSSIIKGIVKVLDRNLEYKLVLPLHLNPQVRSQIKKDIGNHAQVMLVESLSYGEFSWLMSKSSMIITDSGGVQEEATYFNIPIIVARDTTERPEGIESGHAFLVGRDGENLYNKVTDLLENQNFRPTISMPYGDGLSSIRIVKHIEEIVFNEE